MCGIAGYVGAGSEQILRAMSETIRHRGPDDQGILVRDNVGLAHRRLSIIDLSPAGHQPMVSDNGKHVIIFNGEIYNFLELKKEFNLSAKYAFHGSSDTEVILALYAEMGEAVFSKLNGMFAIALYDFEKKKLLLARDRLGKKPLYYSHDQSMIFFGSELKALIQHPLFRKTISLKAFNKYLLYEYVPTPDTIFENTYKLEPGTFLTWQNNTITKKSFWHTSYSTSKLSLSEACEKLDQHLDRSTRMRLVSDVPLGIFLSGGLDSSAIAYYAQKNSSQKIKTYSIGFTESSYDETQYAREVAKLLGTDHHEQVLSAKDSLELIPRIADFLDEPMADPSIIPTYLLSRFTREHVTVALGGDGGDELFAGYPTFLAHRAADIYKKLPSFLRKGLIEKAIGLLPTKDTNFSLDFVARKFIEGIDAKREYRNQIWLGSFSKEERAMLIKPEVWQTLKNENEFEDIDRYNAEIRTNNFYDKLLYRYLRTYMMDQVLVKVDRASMYRALEVRAPFLDFELVDFVNSLPFNYKLRGLTTKYILKKTMQGKLPDKIINRTKKGFGIPLAGWLRSELKGLCTDLLSPSAIASSGFFNYDYVLRLQTEHFEKKKNNSKKLWTLLVFQLWYKKWYS